MTARRSSRPRQRRSPAPSLPRPSGAEVGASDGGAVRRDTDRIGGQRIQVHHVTADYGYVKKDLITIAVVGAVTLGFIVGISLGL